MNSNHSPKNMEASANQAQLAIAPPSHNLMDIPDEVLEKVLTYLPFDDVLSLTLVCHNLANLIRDSGRIWKHMLWKMYPGVSLLNYSVKNHSLWENESSELPMESEKAIKDESDVKFIDNEEVIRDNIEPSKPAKKLCLQFRHASNYWKRQFDGRHSIGIRSKDWMSRMSSKFFHVQELSNTDKEEFLKLANGQEEKLPHGTDSASEDDEITREFVLDALLSLIHDGKCDCELTIKYYATKIIRYVRNRFSRYFWIQFKQSDKVDDQDYYQGLVYFSQWFQPLSRICIASVKFDVECIAIDSAQHLRSKYPQHTLFDAEKVALRNNTTITKTDFKGDSADQFRKYLFPEKLDRNNVAFGVKETFQVLDALNYVMFEEKGFRGNTTNYYNPNNSFIDKVLETRQGIPITLCILYSLIAERLGIILDPINFPRHFLLRWKTSNDEYDCTYIDAFQKGKRLSEAEVKEMDEENTSVYVAAEPIEVFQRMVRNMVAIGQMQGYESDSQSYSLLRAALELQKLIGADFEHPGFGLVQLYLQQNINHREILKELGNFENWPHHMWLVQNNHHLKQQVKNLRRLCMRQLEDNAKELEESSKAAPKFRVEISGIHRDRDIFPEMGLYAVGMVMKHKRYNYLCVIYGWDAVCNQSKVWIRQMGVDRLPWKENQPFYNVLVEDGSCRYAASENLMPAKPQRIPGNPQVGKYFVEFDESIGYIPNNELTNMYPEDSAVAVQFEGSWRKNRNSSSSNSETNS